MDLSAIIVVISLTALFFGFIVWLAVYSRKNDSQKSSDDIAEINFSEANRKNKQYSEKPSV